MLLWKSRYTTAITRFSGRYILNAHYADGGIEVALQLQPNWEDRHPQHIYFMPRMDVLWNYISYRLINCCSGYTSKGIKPVVFFLYLKFYV